MQKNGNERWKECGFDFVKIVIIEGEGGHGLFSNLKFLNVYNFIVIFTFKRNGDGGKGFIFSLYFFFFYFYKREVGCGFFYLKNLFLFIFLIICLFFFFKVLLVSNGERGAWVLIFIIFIFSWVVNRFFCYKLLKDGKGAQVFYIKKLTFC